MSIHRIERGARIAVIDIGSTSVRLAIAEVEAGGEYRILDEAREMVRLGGKLHRSRRLSRDSMERAIEVIGKMKTIACGFGVTCIRAVATSAVREASNRQDFCREAARQHGVEVEVLPAEDEARAAFASASRHFDFGGLPTVVIDLGGGSLELAFGTAGSLIRVDSLPLGTVRLTEEHCRSDPLGLEDRRSLERAVDRALDEHLREPPFVPLAAVGSGGTINALARIAGCASSSGTVHGQVLTRAQVMRILEDLLESPVEGRRRIRGLKAGRADIILAGALTLARVLRRLDCRELIVNERGIRDGILIGMIPELGGPGGVTGSSRRLESARLLSRKCRSQEPHCEHVAKLASMVFEDLRTPADLPPGWGEILQAAALLHEAGRFLGYSKHHKRAYHLILHGELQGFSAREIELIANVVRYHRGSSPKKSHENFARLDRSGRRLVKVLAGILRLANALDRSHARGVDAVRCRKGTRRWLLRVEAEPRPGVEIAVETEEAAREAGLLEDALGCRIEVEYAEPSRVPESQPRLALARV